MDSWNMDEWEVDTSWSKSSSSFSKYDSFGHVSGNMSTASGTKNNSRKDDQVIQVSKFNLDDSNTRK